MSSPYTERDCDSVAVPALQYLEYLLLDQAMARQVTARHFAMMVLWAAAIRTHRDILQFPSLNTRFSLPLGFPCRCHSVFASLASASSQAKPLFRAVRPKTWRWRRRLARAGCDKQARPSGGTRALRYPRLSHGQMVLVGWDVVDMQERLPPCWATPGRSTSNIASSDITGS